MIIPTAAAQRLTRPDAGWTPAQATQAGPVRRAYIGIGGNLHSPEQQLQRAAQALARRPTSAPRPGAGRRPSGRRQRPR